LTWAGEIVSSGHVSRAVQSAWSKSGIKSAIITCTVVRKTAVAAVHDKRPAIKSHLADLMCHRLDTASRCYRRVQREKTSAAAAAELADVGVASIIKAAVADEDDADREVYPEPEQCDESSAAISPSTKTQRDHSIFSADQVTFLNEVFHKMIRCGPTGHDQTKEILMASAQGRHLLSKFSIAQITSRIKYERRKCIASVLLQPWY